MARVLRIFIVSQGDFFFFLLTGEDFPDCAASGTLITDYIIVVLHLNADSLSCHMKAALILGEIAMD